jgi:Ca2+-binding EF-hand superfamily protein
LNLTLDLIGYRAWEEISPYGDCIDKKTFEERMKRFSVRNPEKLFAILDRKGDRKVCGSDFKTYIADRQKLKKHEHEIQDMYAELQKHSKVDEISFAAFEKFFASCDISGAHTKELFNEIDANGNGYISFQEFDDYLKRKYDVDHVIFTETE